MIKNNHGGAREGAGRNPLSIEQKKIGSKIYITEQLKDLINKYGTGENFSTKAVELLTSEINNRKNNKKIKFIDLFAGLGGLRLGFEQAFKELGFETECIMTSEIKPYAIEALKTNFEQDNLVGDIREVDANDIKDFDFLLAGFPCQAFSTAGKGLGFLDTRGTLFFEVERILREKKPYGFILENVEGLVLHDKENSKDEIGRTLTTILGALKKLGYKVEWRLLEAQNFGVPQLRKRVFIVGTLDEYVNLDNFQTKSAILSDALEQGKPLVDSHFTRCLLKHYKSEELHGKAIKDKRGGDNNIHSWDIGLKGEISKAQKTIIEMLFKERRKKHWAEEIGIKWMDGMPLTLQQISTFYNHPNLKELLDDLVKKNYLVMEHPKDVVKIKMDDGSVKEVRRQDETKPKGYNIVAGKLSFEFTKILDSYDIAPTLVATDVSRLGVIDGEGIRKLTIREGLRLFGYPETYSLEMFNNKGGISKAFDLLGNTVVVPVVKEVAKRLGEIYMKQLEKRAKSVS
ncbi:DNA (cytosine-5-)-methyltransferase [Clostridium botulinum]|uniref:DNA (cytosine-5-)-methyltransferase n=1 Tax=Clostridium botulinum TaxID=1491 RepID=UPI003DA37391